MGIAVYPTDVVTFADKQDHVDPVLAAHVNALQDEIASAEAHIGPIDELPVAFLNTGGAAVTRRVSPMIDAIATWVNSLKATTTSLQTQVNGKQATDADLTAIAGLSGTNGYLKKTGANAWSLDTDQFARQTYTTYGTNVYYRTQTATAVQMGGVDGITVAPIAVPTGINEDNYPVISASLGDAAGNMESGSTVFLNGINWGTRMMYFILANIARVATGSGGTYGGVGPGGTVRINYTITYRD